MFSTKFGRNSMPVRHRRTRAGSSRGARRKLVWAQFSATVTYTAVNQYVSLDLLQTYKAAVGASSAGITIMRTHLTVSQTTAPTPGQSQWLGLRVDDLAQVVNVPAAVAATNPNPRDNPYVDWMLSDQVVYDNEGQPGRAQSPFQGWVIDLRAKRRMEEVQEAYLLTLVNDTGVAASSLHVFSRVLIALP
jgi:hypothetical protein